MIPNEILIVVIELACDLPAPTLARDLSDPSTLGDFRDRFSITLENYTTPPPVHLLMSPIFRARWPGAVACSLALVSKVFNAIVTSVIYRILVLEADTYPKWPFLINKLTTYPDLGALVREFHSSASLTPVEVARIAAACPNLDVFVPLRVTGTPDTRTPCLPSFPRLRALHLHGAHINSLSHCLPLAKQAHFAAEHPEVPSDLRTDPAPLWPCLHSLHLYIVTHSNLDIFFSFLAHFRQTSLPKLTELTFEMRLFDIAHANRILRSVSSLIPTLRYLNMDSIGRAYDRESSIDLLAFVDLARALHAQRGMDVRFMAQVFPSVRPAIHTIIPIFGGSLSDWENSRAQDALRALAYGTPRRFSDPKEPSPSVPVEVVMRAGPGPQLRYG